jgi:hypothetical protein
MTNPDAGEIATEVKNKLTNTEFESLNIHTVEKTNKKYTVLVIAHTESFTLLDSKENPDALKEVQRTGEVHPVVTSQPALAENRGPHDIHFRVHKSKLSEMGD